MTQVNAFATRLLDIDADSNFNPITGLGSVPSVGLEEAIRMAQSGDQEFQSAKLDSNIFCAQAFYESIQDKETVLDPDEVAIIHLYTQESPFYQILNTRLRNSDREALKPFFPLLKLLLTALYKLPPVSTNVFRGVKKNLTSQYQKGKKKIWWSFGSSTVDIEVLQSEQFLGKQGERTMFNITTLTSRDISRYSAISKEKELLMLPGTVLYVEGVLDVGESLRLVQLKELSVPGLVDLQPPVLKEVLTQSGGTSVSSQQSQPVRVSSQPETTYSRGSVEPPAEQSTYSRGTPSPTEQPSVYSRSAAPTEVMSPQPVYTQGFQQEQQPVYSRGNAPFQPETKPEVTSPQSVYARGLQEQPIYSPGYARSQPEVQSPQSRYARGLQQEQQSIFSHGVPETPLSGVKPVQNQKDTKAESTITSTDPEILSLEAEMNSLFGSMNNFSSGINNVGMNNGLDDNRSNIDRNKIDDDPWERRTNQRRNQMLGMLNQNPMNSFFSGFKF